MVKNKQEKLEVSTPELKEQVSVSKPKKKRIAKYYPANKFTKLFWKLIKVSTKPKKKK